MILDIDEWRVSERTYWAAENSVPVYGDPGQLIAERLEEASRLMVRADVPVGVALSSGLDSSSIAALAAEATGSDIRAFTVGYPDRGDTDERAGARRLAEELRIPCHEIELPTSEMVSSFSGLVHMRDDPVADISGHGYYSVSKLAAEHGVPVLLFGQGGDELFWGYSSVRRAALEAGMKKWTKRLGWGALPLYLRPNLPMGVRRWQIRKWLESWCGLSACWKTFRHHSASAASHAHIFDRSPDFLDAEAAMRTALSPGYRDRLSGGAISRLLGWFSEIGNPEIRMTVLIMKSYLAANGIVQGDRLSMASSVEMRLPLVDHRLVETVLGLRMARSDLNMAPKQWLRDAMREVLPAWAMDRPKLGFAPPMREWYRALFAAYGRCLDDGYLVEADVLDRAAAVLLSSGPIAPGTIMPFSFKALVLEQWCRGMQSVCSPTPPSHGPAARAES